MKDIEFDVQEYEFASFTNKPVNGEVQEFEFGDLDVSALIDRKKQEQTLKIEREVSQEKGFDISPIVKQHRGISKQEFDEREKKIEDEVTKRVARIEEEAFRKGYEDGMSKGREDVYNETRAATDEKLISLSEMISDVLSTKEEILKAQKSQLYTLIRNLTKWITLRELKDDGKYVERLLEKLILEAQTKTNLLIQVDQKHFELMPEVLERVQDKLGEFVNVRVESDFDIQGTGIIIESSNGIINGTLNEQFKSLDKIFESVGIDATGEEVDFKALEEDESPSDE